MICIPMKLTRHAGIREEIITEMRAGKIFIYPTDTIYGVGCSALHGKSIERIRAIKKRDARKPFSVIAPSKKWITEQLFLTSAHRSYLKKLPGKYTLIFPKKKKSFLKEANSSPDLGVRIPAHPISELIKDAGIPFVTTSVNLSGKPPIARVGEIPLSVLKKIDYVLDEGILRGKPSTVYDLTGTFSRIVRK